MAGAAWPITADQSGESDGIGVARSRFGDSIAEQRAVVGGILPGGDAPRWESGETRARVCQGESQPAEPDHPRIDSRLLQPRLLAFVGAAAFTSDDEGIHAWRRIACVHPVRGRLRILSGRATNVGGGLMWVCLDSKIQGQKFLDGFLRRYYGRLGSVDAANFDRGLVARDRLHAKSIHREMIVHPLTKPPLYGKPNPV